MKRLVSVLVLMLVVSAGVAQAQQPGRGGRGGFGGGPGGGSSAILGIPEVQKELGLSDDQKKQLAEIAEKARPDLGSFNREEFAKLSDDEQAKRRDEMRKKFEESAAKALEQAAKVLDAKQNERFGQLRLQRDGAMALGQKDVGEKLGLSKEQHDKIGKIQEEARSAGRGAVGGGGSDEDRRAAFEKFQKAREKQTTDLLAVLTTEQKASWDKMQGAKFEFPRGGFGGPGGGAPGAGGGTPRTRPAAKPADDKK